MTAESGAAPLYGVDTMVFVYHFEDHEELGPAAGRWPPAEQLTAQSPCLSCRLDVVCWKCRDGSPSFSLV
jgi:hypothetical protein